MISLFTLDHLTLLTLPVIAFVAFSLKAMTGFGPAIVVISLGSLLFPPQAMIATSSILEFIAGAVLFRASVAKESPRFLLVLTAAMVMGTLIGAAALTAIPPAEFKPLLGFAILALALWFALFRARDGGSSLKSDLPKVCDRQDLSYSCLAGLCGGLFGISGPPIIWHLGRRYQKDAFRSILITVFVVEALTRVVIYSVGGLVDGSVLFYLALCLPGLFLGIYVGNRMFFDISERRFNVIVGVILLAISAKLLL